jgi:enoyl-CoA hydratase/carnithine racemase
MFRRISYSFSLYIKLSTYQDKYINIAKLELNNPKKKNALSIDLLNELDVAVK